MRGVRLRKWIGALLVFCLAGAGSATAAPQLAPGLHVKILRSDTVLAADGSAVAMLHGENEADNSASVMAIGQTSIPYVTAYQTLDIIEAYTRKADGTKIPVDVSAIYDQLPPGGTGMPMFTDIHVKTIVFPQFSVGDTAVYTARLTTKHAIFPGQFWSGDAFPGEIAYDDVQETLTAPASLALHVENHRVGFEKSQKDGQTVYRWHYGAPRSAAMEPSAFPLAQLPHFFISTFQDYAALGRAYAQAAAPESAATPAIKALADNITKGAHGRREEVRTLYQWVAQHIRYVAIELGKGTLIPHAADTVLSNGYGDCKDHVALLGALLASKGIANEAVLLNATTIYGLSDVATFAGLNHVITYVPGLNLYLDSTPAVAPFGVLPFAEYGKPAVYASETAPRLGSIPVLPAGLANVTMKTAAHLGRDGVLSGTTTTTAAGPYSIQLRLVGLVVQALGPEASAKRVLAADGRDSSASGTLQAPAPTELSDSYAVSGSFTENGWSGRLAGTEAFYLPGGMRLLGVSGDGLMGSFANSHSKADTEIPCYSGQASEDLSLEAPTGARFASMPTDTHVNVANVRFDAHWTLANGTLSVHRHFTSSIDRPLCTVAMRAANAEALKTISDSYNLRLSFAASGQPAHQEWYASDIANPPKDPRLAAMLEDGLAALQHHEDDAAIAKFTSVLARPGVPISASYPSRYNLAVLYARHWKYDEALANLNAGLTLTPGDWRMLVTRAHVYFSSADFSHALADCETELGQHPNDPAALQLRANIAMETGRYEDAIRDYTGELQLARNQNDLVLRAIAYHRLERERDAAADITQATQLGDAGAKADYDEITGAARPAGIAGDAPASSTTVAETAWRSAAPGLNAPTAANPHTLRYPPLSRRLGEMGRVTVEFVIGIDGSAADPKIEKSSGFPALDAAALASMKTWRYHPALDKGNPVATRSHAQIGWVL